MHKNIDGYLPSSILTRLGRQPDAGHDDRLRSQKNIDGYRTDASLKRLGRARPIYRELTEEEKRINLVRFSYSANRGFSYMYDKHGNPSAEYLRELAGMLTLWDHVRRFILNIG